MIRCHKYEALNCPQEEYPARLLPTPPPCYIDSLQRRLIKVRKGIFPVSLKMILKTKYPLPERRPAPETSVQPDDVIGENRARENSPSSQCNPPPRRAAVDTVSEEPGTPQRSPAIDTESGPGVSRAETQMEGEEIFPLETSMDGFFAFELHKHRAGVDFDAIRRRCKRQSSSTRSRNGRQQRRYHTTSRRSREVRETYEDAAAARDDSLGCRAEQAI